MQIRSVIKLGVVLSVVLFCIGIAFYGFARLSMADKESRVDVLNLFLKIVRVFLKRITLIILCMAFTGSLLFSVGYASSCWFDE